jgi:hypothetical protein
MAQTFYQPNYATDRRFAPSGFTIPSGPSIEEQNRMANAPAPVARPVQQGQAPAGAANPMDTLNKTLGLNIGAPYQNSAMRQAGESAPIKEQIGQAMVGDGGLVQQRQAAQFQQAMTERGGMPDPNSPYFAQQMKVANAMFQQIYGKQAQPGNGQGAFGQPSTSYAPTGLRSRVLGAGGAEVEGIGGAMVSAAPNAQGGNSFMLRQGQPSSFMPPSVARAPAAQAPSGPSAAAMKFLQDGIDPNITAPAPMRQPVVAAAPQPVAQPAQPAPNALQQAQQEYQARMTAMTAPRPSKPNLGTDQEMGPDGRARYIPGSEGEMKARDLADKAKLRQRNAAENARSVIGFIDDAIPNVNRLTAGLGAAAFSKLPGTSAKDLATKLDSIKANIGFDRLQQMRQESPTGGALGQVAVKELDFLQSVRGSLDNWQSREELTKNLGLVKKSYERFLMANAGFDPDTAEGRKAFYQASEGQPIGSTGSTGSNPIKITSIRRID